MKGSFKILSILSLCFAALASNAQDTPYPHFIRNISNDSLIASYKAAAEDFELVDESLFDEFEVRTETDRFDPERQEYLFRTSFANLRERKYQKALDQSYYRRYDIKAKDLLAETLVDQYNMLLDVYFLEKELEIALSTRTQIQKEKEIILKRLEDDPVKYSMDLYKIEDEIIDINLSVEDLENTIKSIISLLDASRTQNDISWNNFMSIEQLYTNFEKVAQVVSTNADLEREENNLTEQDIKEDIETSQKNQVLDFVQVRYAGRDNVSTLRSFNIGAGFIIPTKNKNARQFNEIEKEKLEAELEIKEIVASITKEMQIIQSQFYKLQKQYETRSTALESNEFESKLRNQPELWLSDPMDVVLIEKSRLDKQQKLIQIEYELYKLYVDYLEINGNLYSEPDINYFHPDWENL